MYLKRQTIYKKSNLIMLLFIFVFSFATGCSSEETQYAFPLDSEVVEKVLAEQELSWHIRESQSFKEGHMYHLCKNENDKNICVISSQIEDGMKFFVLDFFLPTVEKSQIVKINENEWQDMFKLACTLYGNSKEYKRVYREFVKYTTNRRSSEYGATHWTKRIGEAHFWVSLYPLEESTKDFALSCISIMNTDAYEKYLQETVNKWRSRITSVGIEILENITISDIISINEDDNDLVMGLIVKGHLENIRKLKDDELPSITVPNVNTIPYKEDYLSAKLVDDTGSIQVILRTTPLNQEELGQVRNHHINYFNKDNTCVIDFSVLSE